MQKKVIGIILCIFVVALLLPTTHAVTTEEKESSHSQEIEFPKIFTTCYIEASGDISTTDWPRIIGSNMWKLTWFRPFRDDRALVSYWQLVLDSSATIEIYDQKDGTLLYEHIDSDHQQMRIIGYYGIYIPSESETDSPLNVELNGRAIALIITDR
jgi:hypothetical protein